LPRGCAAALVERDPRYPPGAHGDGLEAHVEPLQVGPERKPGLGGEAHPARLLRADGLDRGAEAGAAPRLHLADHDRSPAADDEVDLVPARPGVGGEDAVATEPEVTADPPLGFRPEPR
jgi:hypothetical protein